MRHFLLLAVGVALLDFSSAAQPPQDARGEGRPAASSAPSSPKAAIPAAAILNPSRSLHQLLAQAAHTVREEENQDGSPAAAVAAVQSQGSSATLPSEAEVSVENSSSPTPDTSPVEESPPQEQGFRSELEKLLAQAAVVQAETAKATNPKGSGERRRRHPRRRAPQLNPVPAARTSVAPTTNDDIETPMSLDDVFNQISKVSLFTRPTETKLPVRARKDKKGKSTKKKKGRWNHLDQNSGKDSEDEDAPILAVLPRKPPPRGSPQPKFSSSRDSVSKGASSETEPSTPQAALQQLLSDTAGSMGIAAWSPPKGDAPQESTESPPPTVEEAPILSQKGSRSALEDLLQQASANAASAARRKKAHRGNFQLGKKNSQVRQKGSKTGEDDEPILAVLPRRPPTPHLPTSVQGNFKSIPGNPLNQEASPQEALQQLLANSMGASSWAELESSKKPEAADGIQEDSEEGNTTQAANVAPAGGPLPQSLQRRSSSDAPSGPQSTGTHEAKVPEEAAENAESTNEESTVAPRTAAAAAAAWDMRKAILAARKAAEAAKAARAAATSAKGISAMPGPPNGQISGFEFGRIGSHLKWEEEDSMSEETTESEESLSNESSANAGGWDSSSRAQDAAERPKSYSDPPQWQLNNRGMAGLPRSTQQAAPASPDFFPSMGAAERTPSSSEQYEDDSDFGRDAPWEEPPAFGALQKGSEESSARGAAGEAGQPTQQAPQNSPAAAAEQQRMAPRPLKDGSKVLGNSSMQQNTAAGATQVQPQKETPSAKTQKKSHPGGDSPNMEGDNAGNSYTLSGGWGPAIVFGFMVGVAVCVGLGIWLHSHCARKQNNNAAKTQDSSATLGSIWATSADLSART